MRLVDKYLSQAEECRKIAAQVDVPDQHRAIELMADTWEMLAAERRYLDLKEQEKRPSRH